MSQPILYQLSVPIYIHTLEALVKVLKKGEEHAKENGYSVDKLVQANLHSDMKPLSFQIQSASNTAKAIVTRLGDGENVSMEDNETTYAQLAQRVEKTIDILKTAKPENFANKENASVAIKLPGVELKFTGVSYLQEFGLPNFYFHVVTAYDILRKEGVPIGKRDYLGPVGQA